MNFSKELTVFLLGISFAVCAGGPAESIVRSGKTFVYSPRYQYADEPRSFAGGLPVFYRRNPEECSINSIPRADEEITELRKFTVPGENCNLYFMIHAPRKTEVKTITFGKLKNEKGDVIDGKMWEVFFVEQGIRLRKPGTKAYEVIPERIKEFNGTELNAGDNLIVWIQGKPESAVPGTYRGKIDVTFPDGVRSLPLELKILPIRVSLPENIDYLMYANIIAQKEKRVQFVREIADLGITGIVHHMGLNGEREVREFWDALNQAGMKTRINVLDYGPVLIHRTIHEVTGRPPRNPNAACYEECEEPRVMAGFMNRLSDLDRWMKLYGQPASVWHYQGWDEPYLTSKVKQALWETTLVRKAGIRNTATVYDARGITEMGAYGLLTSINGTSMNNPERFRELTAIGRMLRVGFWLLGAGAYEGTQGAVAPNRHYAGLLFFKSGFPVHVSWTYNWEMDEFGQTNAFVYAMAYKRPAADKKATWSTLQLEGLREGILDYKFAATLRGLIAEGKKRKLKEAEEAERVLNWILEEQTGWSGTRKLAYDAISFRTVDNEMLENLRLLMANEIMKLEKVIR